MLDGGFYREKRTKCLLLQKCHKAEKVTCYKKQQQKMEEKPFAKEIETFSFVLGRQVRRGWIDTLSHCLFPRQRKQKGKEKACYACHGKSDHQCHANSASAPPRQIRKVCGEQVGPSP